MLSIEFQPDGSIKSLDNDLLAEIFPEAHLSKKRLSNIEWDDVHQWWCVVDLKIQDVVAYGFRNRKDAIDWEKANYQPGTQLWRQYHG